MNERRNDDECEGADDCGMERGKVPMKIQPQGRGRGRSRC